VGADRLTGADVLESSLGTVPRAVEADRLGGLTAGTFARGGGSVLRARVELTAGQADIGLLSIPGVGSLAVTCGNPATSVTTRFTNLSGRRLVRVHGQRLDTTTDVTGGDLDPNDSTNRTTTNSGNNAAHLHHYELAPADGPGPIAHVRIAAVTSIDGDNRCVFSATGIAG
jgi:hypothetical protein